MANQPSQNRVNKANRRTVAARYNVKVLRSLEATLLDDPEADIAAILSSSYSQKLQTFKTPNSTKGRRTASLSTNDLRHRLNGDEPTSVIFPLSAEIEKLANGHPSRTGALIQLLKDSEVLYESAWAASVMVFRVSETIVAKAGHEDYSITEHRTLTYLQEHLPDFPAPRPHGLVRLGAHCLLFTSFIPGVNLEKAWTLLDHSQKHDIAGQIGTLLFDMRSIPVPKNTLLGDVESGRCRDLRRSQRISKEPITSVSKFEDFIFSGSETATPLYINMLRELMPETKKIVFTHGDIRPANIMVKQNNNGTWTVVAIIDWESSGFYPEYWEAVKATNLLSPREQVDWYHKLSKSK
ncbi:Protein kinase-like domain protein [Metarhizium rileyi]|uniref:Protein kinase-like domain protein n=1 Tax=Metarhizium rileyi (strain RCEF 4871) TaxID=1649241 RepID=A0A166S9C9_METRR|nr:Protein kinase-like domain protein [Metarhizium rileyi RCEF 4871]